MAWQHARSASPGRRQMPAEFRRRSPPQRTPGLPPVLPDYAALFQAGYDRLERNRSKRDTSCNTALSSSGVRVFLCRSVFGRLRPSRLRGLRSMPPTCPRKSFQAFFRGRRAARKARTMRSSVAWSGTPKRFRICAALRVIARYQESGEVNFIRPTVHHSSRPLVWRGKPDHRLTVARGTQKNTSGLRRAAGPASVQDATTSQAHAQYRRSWRRGTSHRRLRRRSTCLATQ